MITIRAATASDFEVFKTIIAATDLFPSDMLGGMGQGYLSGAAVRDHWLAADEGGGTVGLAYYVPERMTQGTWNVLLIAVHPEQQGRGVGAALMRHVETALRMQGERVLLVETSSLPELAGTRAFYSRIGFEEEARIRDFYTSDEDKVVFRKSLRQAA